MRGTNWQDQLLIEHREFITNEDARAAFDTCTRFAEQLHGYACEPTWHGDMRTFSFSTSGSEVTTTTEGTNGLREPEGPEDPNWRVAGVGPRTSFEPAPGARPDVVLSMIATGTSTVPDIQAALDRLPAKNQDSKERHTVLGLLRWAAKKHGMSFTCVDGILSTDYRRPPTRPFEFIVNRGHLRFYVRRSGRSLVDEASLRAAFVETEEVNGELAVNVASAAETAQLLDLVFANAMTSTAVSFGRRYIPIGTVTASAPRDPFPVDPDVIDRGNQGHASTQDALAAFLRENGIEPRSPIAGEPKVDLGWTLNDRLWIAEVKSITVSNEETQLRLGLGQVLRYRHELASKMGQEVVAVLVAEREPSDASWLALCESLAVILVSPGSFHRLGPLGTELRSKR